MTYHGHVENGRITLDGPAKLPEGAEVLVELIGSTSREPDDLRALLLRHAGKGSDLPPDLASHHDHYAHGKPKE